MKWPGREPRETQQQKEHRELLERAELERKEREAHKKMDEVLAILKFAGETQKTFPAHTLSDKQIEELTRKYTEAGESADKAAQGLGKTPEEARKEAREKRKKDKDRINLEQRAKMEALRLAQEAAQEKNKQLAKEARLRRSARIQENLAKRRAKGKGQGD